METEAYVPKGGNQRHGARVFAIALKVNQMNYLSGKKNGEDCAPEPHINCVSGVGRQN